MTPLVGELRSEMSSIKAILGIDLNRNQAVHNMIANLCIVWSGYVFQSTLTAEARLNIIFNGNGRSEKKTEPGASHHERRHLWITQHPTQLRLGNDMSVHDCQLPIPARVER